MSLTKQETKAVVWDPIVRCGHWALVVLFALAYLSAEEGDPRGLHTWTGYVVGLIVVLRVLWGFVGSRHARFSDFAYSPKAVLRHARDLLRGRARRYMGHSPAGGVMVIALLLCLAATVGTGLVAYDERGVVAGLNAIVVAPNDGHQRIGDRERAESIVGELHSTLANVTLALVIIHVVGVGLASVLHRENLIAAMIDGRKRRNR